MRALLPLADARLAAGLALASAVATGLLARPPDSVRLDVGGAVGGFLGAGWSDSNRTDLDPEVGALDQQSAELKRRFRFRAAAPGAELRLPVVPRSGDLQLRLRAMARVRTAVWLHAADRPVAKLTVPRGPWRVHALEIPADLVGDGVEATFTLEVQPLVRVPDEYVAEPRVLVAEIVAGAPGGLGFSTPARLLLAVVPLALFAFALAVGLAPAASLVASLVAASVTVRLAGIDPLPLLAAIPRLFSLALAAGLLTGALLGRQRELPRTTRAALSLLVVVGTLFHGCLAFVPGYDPYDVEVHVRRTLDLGNVPLEYDALLRYGSHLPTESQSFGAATQALGERSLIPYSPLPYVAYYLLHRAGIELHWGMMVLNVLVCMAVVPWLWLVARRLWDPVAAWVATLLYILDLPLWHHTARSHAPSVFGAALTAVALLFLARSAGQLDGPGRAARAGGLLALAALGYSSQAVLLGLFGIVLLLLLALDARGLVPPARAGVAVALVVGGLLAGALFYFHFIPGLLQGVGPLQAEPDLYPGRSFLIFHNESRQSMRIWVAGFVIPLGAGLLAFPLALRRALPSARPILTAWLGAWALVMLLKEPSFFPRPLRWAKEEQFVSPLLALLIGGALTGIPRAGLRWTLAIAAVATAIWLQLGDFRTHFLDLLP